MSSISQQITSDIKLIQNKLRGVSKIPIRYLIGLGVLGVVTIGMLVGLIASRQSTEDRSQAAGGGPKFYLSKPASPMNVTSVVLPRETEPPTFTPVTDIQVLATAGRPVTSFSFVAKLTNGTGERLSLEQADRTWEQFVFTFNPKISAADTIQEKLYQAGSPANMVGVKLFSGTIGQQVATVQNTVWDPVRLGSFTFTPIENQPDVQLHLVPIADRPEANSLYLKGSLISSADGEEQISPENLIGPFSIRNPFYVDPDVPANSPTPTPGVSGDIGIVPIMQLVNGQWQSLPATFDFVGFAGTDLIPKYLRTEISNSNVFSPWWRESTSVGFRMQVKNGETGSYRTVILPNGQSNPNATELVQWLPDGSYSGGTGKLFARWEVISQGNEYYIKIPTTLASGVTNLANPGQRLLFKPGDTLEIRANVHIQNYPNHGVSRTCKVDSTIVESPIGNPAAQVQVGACRNNSVSGVAWASANVTPSVTPSFTPTVTPTPTSSPAAFNCDSYTSLRRSECESLVSLYTKTAGDQWSNTLADDKTWLNTDTDYCQWYGITCTPSPSFRVWRISLANNNLTGSMLSQVIFSGLTELRFLDLNGNQLGGQIPQNLSTLTKLTSLLLGNNNFSGTIPTFFASMNLFTISLENNQLTGSVPAELFKSAGTTVVGLQSIHLDRNSLRGELAIRSTDATRATALKVLLFHNQLNAQNARDNNQLCVSADGRAALEIIQARMGSNVNPAPPIPPVCPT